MWDYNGVDIRIFYDIINNSILNVILYRNTSDKRSHISQSKKFLIKWKFLMVNILNFRCTQEKVRKKDKLYKCFNIRIYWVKLKFSK